MSLNISGTRYVKVYDTEIRLQVSDKIVFARLSTSRKTGNDYVDKGTGEIKMGNDGKPLAERAFSSWEARFCGNAFEPAKGLHSGQSIDIVNGWIVNEPYTKKNGEKGYFSYVTITEFSVCDVIDSEEESEGIVTGGDSDN